MSTATAFKYHRPFPFCPASGSPDVTFDYMDVSLAEAMALFWNLENLSFETSCSRGAANINWTTTYGATESLPFVPSSRQFQGEYYSNTSPTTPARAPRNRVCTAFSPQDDYLFNCAANRGTSQRLSLQIVLRESPTTGQVRIYYKFSFSAQTSSTNAVIIANPSFGLPSNGSLPSSGSFDILGIPLQWWGGGYDPSLDAWTSETATISCTSSAFTY